jgi:hypothetical protein
MALFFGFVLGAMFMACILMGYQMVFAYGPDETIYIGGDYPRTVPIYYVDKIEECGGSTEEGIRGCYMPNYPETILVERDAIFAYTSEGCTVRDHEILHAWGYAHIDDGPAWRESGLKMPLCPNPLLEVFAEEMDKRMQAYSLKQKQLMEEKLLEDQQEMLQGQYNASKISHREPIHPGPGHVYESLLILR